MLKDLLKGFLSTIVVPLLDDYRRLSIQLLRIEAAKAYLRGVRMARASAMGLIGMGLLIGLICVGVVLFHAGLFILLPWRIEVKAILGMLLGIVYMAIGAVALHVAMDERTWMVKSGAAEMLEEAIGRSKKE